MEPLEPLSATPYDPKQMAAETAAKAMPGLSPTQLIALECLLAGQSMIDSAAAAGVDRSTLHRWLRNDFNFQAGPQSRPPRPPGKLHAPPRPAEYRLRRVRRPGGPRGRR